MKKHVKIYMSFFGYCQYDFIPCEICGARAVDIHHIDARGMGGSKYKDTVDNLMAVCREHHLEFGDKKQHIDYLKLIHGYFTELNKS